MIKIKFRNKKAQISDTLTWIIATLIIFFIMFFFVAIVSLWAAKEKITLSKLSVEKEKIQPHSDFILTGNLIYFLSSHVENGEDIYDVISRIDADDGQKERVKIFKREAEKFLEENLPVDNKHYSRTWFRIYKSNEEIEQNYISKFGYEVYKIFKSGKGGIYCDPEEEKGTVFSTILIAPDKKIAVCGNEFE